MNATLVPSPQPDIAVTCEVGDDHADFLESHVRRAWALLDGPPRVLSVAVVGAATMADLHQRFLNIPEPTDVLTFELARGPDGRVAEGEVVVCLDVAAEQAAARGHAVAHELLLYAVHGLLHLSGYDDQTDAGHAEMHAREDEVLRALGIGPVFARASREENGHGSTAQAP